MLRIERDSSTWEIQVKLRRALAQNVEILLVFFTYSWIPLNPQLHSLLASNYNVLAFIYFVQIRFYYTDGNSDITIKQLGIHTLRKATTHNIYHFILREYPTRILVSLQIFSCQLRLFNYLNLLLCFFTAFLKGNVRNVSVRVGF
jgi:hypothetical protein